MLRQMTSRRISGLKRAGNMDNKDNYLKISKLSFFFYCIVVDTDN